MKDKKYIIFDLYDTLVDSFPAIVNACKCVFEEYAPSAVPADEVFENYRGSDMEQMFMNLSIRLNLSTNEFREKNDAKYDFDCWSDTTIIQQQYAILKDAKARGSGMIVLTNKRQELAETVCRTVFGENAVDAVIGRKDTVPIKPRHVIKDCFRQLGIHSESLCLMYYGDLESDCDVA